MLWIATVPAATYIPLAVGAFMAAVGVLGYLSGYEPPSTDEESAMSWSGRRRLALVILSGVFRALAGLLLIVALIVGGKGFVITAGLLMALALGVFLSYLQEAG